MEDRYGMGRWRKKKREREREREKGEQDSILTLSSSLLFDGVRSIILFTIAAVRPSLQMRDG